VQSASVIENFWIPATTSFLASFSAGRVPQSPLVLPVLLSPYETPACRFQHHSLAAELRLSGQRAVVLLDPLSSKAKALSGREPLSFSSFSNLAEGILSICDGDPVLARGALDEFLRNCPVESFFDEFRIDSNFLDMILLAKREANEVMSRFSGLVVADGAYLKNRALISAALGANKPVRVFNPDGRWLPVSRHKNENTNQVDFQALCMSLTDQSPTLIEAEDYMAVRFSGTAGDFDSAGVFSGGPEVPTELRPKKVFFLHVVRDANQIPLEEPAAGYSVFSSYFEWADFCLEEIAKRPHEWVVKLHPSAKFYGGEEEIQAGLLRKHSIPQELVDSCPTTSFILANKWPVYTHSGTIGIEAAVSGYRAHVCSTRYPPELVHIARSRKELVDHLNRPIALAASKIVNPNHVMGAKVLLRELGRPDEPLLMPRRPQPDKTSSGRFFVSLILQEMSLMGRYLLPRTRARLREIAQELRSSVVGFDVDKSGGPAELIERRDLAEEGR